jgi:Uncharacterised protein family (UPF0236)
MATRTSVHKAGAAVLTGLLSARTAHVATVACSCGAEARYHDHRPRQLLTAVGDVEFERAYYVCPECGRGRSPRDQEMDCEGSHYSPAVRRMMAVVGSESSFDQGREQMELLAGLEVTAKAVERQAELIGAQIAAQNESEIRRAKQLELPAVCCSSVPVLYIEMDGTGVPVVKAETEGRTGKVDGQPAHTREVKVGCVFTQATTDEQGRPVRDPDSTTYVGAIENAESFGLRIYTEAWHRGWSHAQRKVVIGDGAVWIWNLADQHFPGAVQIVDLYHARQHLWDLSARLFAGDDGGRKRWLARTLEQLEQGRIEALVNNLRELRPASADIAKLVTNEAEYFERNADRMRYPSFRSHGLFVGSGVIEAACKTVIGARLKRSGMFWTVDGANAIIALRCTRLSGHFEDYWESRRAA